MCPLTYLISCSLKWDTLKQSEEATVSSRIEIVSGRTPLVHPISTLSSKKRRQSPILLKLVMVRLRFAACTRSLTLCWVPFVPFVPYVCLTVPYFSCMVPRALALQPITILFQPPTCCYKNKRCSSHIFKTATLETPTKCISKGFATLTVVQTPNANVDRIQGYVLS